MQAVKKIKLLHQYRRRENTAAVLCKGFFMNIKDSNIDNGKVFDWGRTSHDYAKYRDIYPDEFYRRITDRGLCVSGQSVLDIGTGTGVIPRNMLRFGAKWIGTDISPEQIEQAKLLSQGTDIKYYVSASEDLSFPDNSFDVITACQCFWYFDHEKLIPEFRRMLKSGGSLVVLYMAWLPFEDKIAGMSEELVLKYNPDWSGKGETIHPIHIPQCYDAYFDNVYSEEYPLDVRFTRESWNGRVKACRGIGASLPEEEINSWEKEHIKLLKTNAPPEFDIRHYGAIVHLRLKDKG